MKMCFSNSILFKLRRVYSRLQYFFFQGDLCFDAQIHSFFREKMAVNVPLAIGQTKLTKGFIAFD